MADESGGAAGLAPADGGTLLIYTGSGEVGGLIAGVGQRVLRGISNSDRQLRHVGARGACG